MNLSKLSINGLKMLHGGVADALNKDDATPPDLPKDYEVRSNPDWKEWADKLEGELRKHNVQFDPIVWE